MTRCRTEGGCYFGNIRGTEEELINGKAITLRNLVGIYKTLIEEHGVIDPRTSGALRNEMRRIVTKRLCKKMEVVTMENPHEKNQSQGIIS